jgi:hypothetical protein
VGPPIDESDEDEMTETTCVCCCHLGNKDLPDCSCDHCVRVRAGFGVEIAHVCECAAA